MSKKRNGSKARQRILIVLTVLSVVVYIVWRALFTIPTEFGLLTFLFGALLLLSEAVSQVENLAQLRQIGKDVRPILPEIDNSWYPDVDVLIATHNESTELLYKTVNACNFLNYPDKSKVHVYVCDDNNRPSMAALASSLGVGYIGLIGNTKAKAGNLNNAIKKTDSPLILTLDADMIPTSDFLLRTVPYFYMHKVKRDKDGRWVARAEEEIDPNVKIGFIQTPQSFYNPDLFQFNLFSEQRIPNEQDFFFRKANMGRNAANAAIYAGSNTVISREALESVGGFAFDSITEDFSTGLRIEREGFTCYATDEVLAHGLAPDSIKSLISQRERWGRGCVQSLRNEHLLRDQKVKLSTKVSYYMSLSYWWTFLRRLVFLMAPIAAVVFNMRIVDAGLLEVIAFWLPSYVLMNRTLRSVSGNIRNAHWSNVVDTILSPFLAGPILAETVGISQRKFVVTEKSRKKASRNATAIYSLPHLVLFVASMAALVICIKKSIELGTFYNPIVFFWATINVKNLAFALFFVNGRTNYREAERFYVDVPVTIHLAQGDAQAVTTDISETGLALKIGRPVFIHDAPVEMTLHYLKYGARIQAQVVHVQQVGSAWKYSFRILSMDESNRRQYMQVVYDREHTFPKAFSSAQSIYDDFTTILSRRTNDYMSASRKVPRIYLGLPFTLETGEGGVLEDFNYFCAKVRADFPVQYRETLTIAYGPDIMFVLKLREEGLDGDYVIDLDGPEISELRTGEANLFDVLNTEDLISNHAFGELVDEALILKPGEDHPWVGSAQLRRGESQEQAFTSDSPHLEKDGEG